MINALPLTMILTMPINFQILYFVLSLLIAIFGINRKMGFWGYLFCSIIFSPLIGLMVLLVSEKKKEIV